jgi:hypothetical protein
MADSLFIEVAPFRTVGRSFHYRPRIVLRGDRILPQRAREALENFDAIRGYEEFPPRFGGSGVNRYYSDSHLAQVIRQEKQQKQPVGVPVAPLGDGPFVFDSAEQHKIRVTVVTKACQRRA